MTPTGILAAITALGTLVGGIVYILKFARSEIIPTEDQKNQSIDQQVTEEKQKAEETGRP